MKSTKEGIFAKQMTRKEFIKFAGLGILSLFGVANFVSFLMAHSERSRSLNAPVSQSSDHGFGSRKFGI